ncbi:MAG: hypothetical protein ABIP51_23360 [Bacteroidia bacterium]
MKKLIIIFTLFSFNIFSQTKICEKIYDTPDTLAHYKSERKDLPKYFSAKILPILSDCIKQKMEFVYSMDVKFTIDESGKVFAVEFLKPVLSDYCSGKLRAELLAMEGWQPAKVKGNKVCSIYIYSIGGITWH